MLFFNVRNTQGDIGERAEHTHWKHVQPWKYAAKHARTGILVRKSGTFYNFPSGFFVARETIATICWTATASGTVPPIVRLIVTVEAIAIASRPSCQQSVMAFFVFFCVFLCFSLGPELFAIFSVVFFFCSVHVHRFLQHFGAGNCYFNDMCNIVDVKPLCFFMFFLSAKCPSFRGDPGPKVFVSFLLPLRIFATVMQPLQCVLQQHVHIHSTLHHFPQSLSFVTTLRGSMCTFIQHVTTSLCHHCP